MLILAREEMVAALLGLMVEIGGRDPLFPQNNERGDQAIGRGQPDIVVIDCDHEDCNEILLAAAKDVGARPILFSPFRQEPEVRRVAARFGLESFTLPTDLDRFGQLLRAS